MIHSISSTYPPPARNPGRAKTPGSAWKGFDRFLRDRSERFGNKTALEMSPERDDPNAKSFPGSRISYSDLHRASAHLADRLVSMGIGPGSHVAILSESRPEWAVAFFGTMMAGAVLIPLDSKATLAELKEIVADSRPELLFASSACLDAAHRLESFSGESFFGPQKGILNLESLGKETGAGKKTGFEDKRLSDEALIVYTSGTTGAAKGVVVTVANLVFQMETLVSGFRIREDDCFLSILPLNHLLELTCGMLGVLCGGARTIYCRSLFPADVAYALRIGKATHMITVPYFLRLLAGSLRAGVAGKSWPRRGLFAFFGLLAPVLPVQVRRKLFHAMHEALGGRMRGFISGGAPLDAGTEDFFSRIGARIYQGYGLTETSPVISVNRPGSVRAGSVGMPLPGTEIGIRRMEESETDVLGIEGIEDGEGEILARGPHVMAGYHRRPDLTAQALDSDGWFHTGDIGYLDGKGFLHITGRIKSLIVLEGGKKIHPEEVELILASIRSVKEACVLSCAFSGGKEELVAVVVPHSEFPGVGGTDAGSLSAEAKLRSEIADALSPLSRYKRPARIVFSFQELPRTSTRKIRREAVRAVLRNGGT